MKYVIANWKMKMDMKAITEWYEKYIEYRLAEKPSFEEITPIVAPSFLHIPFAFLKSNNTPEIKISSQDISQYENGSYTGENAPFQVKDFCEYCIVGHSERNEALSVVLQKRDSSLNTGLTPIVCFKSPEDSVKLFKKRVILAWEDPASISGGGQYKDKPIEEIQQNVARIRGLLPKGALLLYGGSVNKNNIKNLAALEQLDGVLVGQASLDPVHFLELIQAYEISRPKN